MARRKRRTSVNSRRRRSTSARRRRNPTRVVVTSRSRRSRRRSYGRRRRNPAVFGASSPKSLLLLIGGGLVGVTAAKMIPAMIPVPMLTSSPIMRVITTGAVAFIAGMIAKKGNAQFGEAVTFGGLMQTGSIALNSFLPSVGARIALQGGRGVGDLVDGSFPVPQNPIRAAFAPAARVTTSGLTRAFGGSAF